MQSDGTVGTSIYQIRGTRWSNVTVGPVIPVIYKNGKRVFGELHKNRIGDKRRKNLARKDV